jgi:hypothetical protein
MSLSVTRAPGTLNNITNTGNAWVNIGNAAASDNVYATYTTTGANDSDYFQAINYGFSTVITDPNARLVGLGGTVEAKQSAASIFLPVGLFFENDGGTSVGTDFFASATTSTFTTTDSNFNYGGDNNLYGTGFNLADVFQSDFGISFIIRKTTATTSRVFSVDYVPITVYYVIDMYMIATASVAITTTGTLSVAGGNDIYLQGSATVSVTDTATALWTRQISGSSNVAVTTTGTIGILTPVSGSANVAVTTTGTVGVLVPITSSASVAVTTTGTALKIIQPTGTATVAITTTGTIQKIIQPTGTCTVTIATSGTLIATTFISGAASIVITTSGRLFSTNLYLSGTVNVIITVNGQVSGGKTPDVTSCSPHKQRSSSFKGIKAYNTYFSGKAVSRNRFKSKGDIENV